MRLGATRFGLPLLAVALTCGLAVHCLLGALATASRPFPGFLLYTSGSVTSLMRRSWEGTRVGLRPGDVLLSVDGGPVHSPADALARLSSHEPGDLVRLEFQRRQGSIFDVQVRLSRLTTSDLGYVFGMPFAIGVLYLALGAIVFFVKRTRAAALVLALCLVAAAFYMTMFDAHWTYSWSRIWVSYPLLGAISIHLFSVFPEEHPRVHRVAVLVPLYAVSGLLVALRQIHLHDASRSDSTSLATGILLALCFVADLALLTTTWARTRERAIRSKARSLAFGLVLTITLSIVWAFVSRLGPVHVTADQAMLLSAAFPVLMGYAILRQNLFDLDAVLQKSLTYGTVTALVIGSYLLLVAGMSALASPLASRFAPFASPRATDIVSTLIIALGISPLRSYVQRAVTRLFYSETVDVGDALLALGRDLQRADTPPELGERVATGLRRALDLRGAALLVVDERLGRMIALGRAGEIADVPLPAKGPLTARLQSTQRPVLVSDLCADQRLGSELAASLERLGAQILVPLAAKSRLVGALALGRRRDGARLSAADLELVAATAPAAAMAVENAALMAERGARERLAALGGVAAVIIHEIKNPIGIIRVSASALTKKFPPSDSGRELAQCIVEEVDRMDGTLRQLLSFARPQPPALASCDINHLVSRTSERMRAELETAGVAVNTEMVGLPPVQADPQQLERVLVNLLQNAAAAMAERGGTISISTRPVRRLLGGRAVEITVADTGCGMNESTRQRLFTPFFTTRPGGNGLGLAIIKQILDEHHADIVVESEPGRGSLFRITLPG